nr:MAG TPA: hypothetical protein [Caudoviricetes sp.]
MVFSFFFKILLKLFCGLSRPGNTYIIPYNKTIVNTCHEIA